MRIFTLVLTILGLFLAPDRTRADSPPESQPNPTLAGAGDIDPFLIPVQAGPSADDRRALRRRRMLQTHQVIGYGTLTLLTTQVALGWADFAKYRRTGFRDPFDQIRKAHFALGLVTWTSYWTGASMAIFAPGLDQAGNRDEGSVGVHKKLAWVHGFGMGILPVWGWLTTEYRNELLGKKNDKAYDYVVASHGAVGTVTLGALAGAYISIMLR